MPIYRGDSTYGYGTTVSTNGVYYSDGLFITVKKPADEVLFNVKMDADKQLLELYRKLINAEIWWLGSCVEVTKRKIQVGSMVECDDRAEGDGDWVGTFRVTHIYQRTADGLKECIDVVDEMGFRGFLTESQYEKPTEADTARVLGLPAPELFVAAMYSRDILKIYSDKLQDLGHKYGEGLYLYSHMETV